MQSSPHDTSSIVAEQRTAVEDERHMRKVRRMVHQVYKRSVHDTSSIVAEQRASAENERHIRRVREQIASAVSGSCKPEWSQVEYRYRVVDQIYMRNRVADNKAIAGTSIGKEDENSG